MGISKEREPFDPTVFNDVVALQTGWHPVERGGSNFRTRRLIQKDPDRMVFRATFGALVFCLVFFGFGFMALGMGVLFALPGNEMVPWMALFPFFGGFLFIATAVWMFRRFTIPIVFDAGSGYFWKGRITPMEVANHNEIKCFAELEDVRALQLISEHCSGKDSSYFSYELNLVLVSARRVNIFDHGHLKSARADAENLAEFLGKPLWDAVQ